MHGNTISKNYLKFSSNHTSFVVQNQNHLLISTIITSYLHIEEKKRLKHSSRYKLTVTTMNHEAEQDS